MEPVALDRRAVAGGNRRGRRGERAENLAGELEDLAGRAVADLERLDLDVRKAECFEGRGELAEPDAFGGPIIDWL